jgi:hypothetical protein
MLDIRIYKLFLFPTSRNNRTRGLDQKNGTFVTGTDIYPLVIPSLQYVSSTDLGGKVALSDLRSDADCGAPLDNPA